MGRRAAALVDGQQVLFTQETASVEESIAALASELRQRGESRSLRVWLSGGICRPFLMPVPEGVRDSDELARVAKGLVQARTGFAGDCEVRVDVGPRGCQPLAVATERTILDHLRAQLGPHSRLAVVRPWWAGVLNALQQGADAPCLLGVRDCDALTVLAGTDASFSLATTASPIESDDAAEAAWVRVQLGTDLPEGDRSLFAAFSLEAKPLDPNRPEVPMRCLARIG